MAKKMKKVKKMAPKKVKKIAVKTVNLTSVKKAFNRSLLLKTISELSNLKKKDVVNVMDALEKILELHLGKRGPGEFVFLGLAKFRVVHKPATKARKGINPFTGEPTTFAAKPARNVVKIKPLKKLKAFV
jgi:nucleoid DNA-binding protein